MLYLLPPTLASVAHLCAVVALAAKAGKPAATAAADGRRHSDRLHIRHSCRAAKDTNVRRERRLEPRLASLALEALNKRSFLAADVRASTAEEVHVKVVARATCILANEAGIVGLFFKYGKEEERVG